MVADTDDGPITLSELPKLPAILIRIAREWRPGLSEAQLYERVRRYWRAQPLARQEPPVLAYGIAEGAIQGVYWIDRWETYDMALHHKDSDRLDQTAHAGGRRVGFIGHPAGEYSYLLGRKLTDPPSGQNPICYLNDEAKSPSQDRLVVSSA